MFSKSRKMVNEIFLIENRQFVMENDTTHQIGRTRQLDLTHQLDSTHQLDTTHQIYLTHQIDLTYPIDLTDQIDLLYHIASTHITFKELLTKKQAIKSNK
mgnify:CR=1 FL=1